VCPQLERAQGEKNRFAGLKALRELFRADPILRRVLLGGTVAACGGGAILTLGLAYVRGTLGAGQGAYSGLLTAFAAGAAIGVAGVSRGRKHLPKLFHLGIGTMGTILIGMAVAMAHSGLRVGAVGMGVLAAWLAKTIGTQQRFLSMDGTQVVLGIAGCALFGVAVLLTRPIRIPATVAAETAAH
jgi:hypothetical protein